MPILDSQELLHSCKASELYNKSEWGSFAFQSFGLCGIQLLIRSMPISKIKKHFAKRPSNFIFLTNQTTAVHLRRRKEQLQVSPSDDPIMTPNLPKLLFRQGLLYSTYWTPIGQIQLLKTKWWPNTSSLFLITLTSPASIISKRVSLFHLFLCKILCNVSIMCSS